MSNLSYRQQKIQEKRKKTPWREFVMEICSWKVVGLYKNQSKYTIFSKHSGIENIITHKEFEESRDGLTNDPNTYDTGDFLNNLQKLLHNVSLPQTIHFGSNQNCEFTDVAYNSKDSYLSFTVTFDCENVLYTFRAGNLSKNIINSYYVIDSCENIADSSMISRSMNVFYSKSIVDSSFIWFSYNLIGCSECIFCDNLQNQTYYIGNKQYSKDEYFKRKKIILTEKNQFGYYYQQVHKYPFANINTSNSMGQGLVNSNNVEGGVMTLNLQHARNVWGFGGKKLSEYIYDACVSGNSDNFYGVCDSGAFSEHIYCSLQLATCANCYYCYLLDNCSFCLGCIGLKNKSYCILNKQYSKEERYEKVDEIFAQMEKEPHPDPLLAGEGENALGAFFPATMNPFYFNDTVAYLIDPSFTKEEVTAKGYLRRDAPIKVDIPAGVQTVKTSELDKFEGWVVDGNFYQQSVIASETKQSIDGSPQSKSSFAMTGTRRIDPEIMKKVIVDDQGNAYRIIPMEYEFLMKHGLPLPRKHWLERMKENFRIS